jgi:hypothetical protein
MCDVLFFVWLFLVVLFLEVICVNLNKAAVLKDLVIASRQQTFTNVGL